jgi:hypothetical protein
LNRKFSCNQNEAHVNNQYLATDTIADADSGLHIRSEPRHAPHEKSNAVVTFAGLPNEQTGPPPPPRFFVRPLTITV